MRTVVRWAVRNGPAMNVLMAAILIVGAVSLMKMRREVFPTFELEIVLVSVPFPGATPSEVEEGICQKIEEAVRSTEHVKKVTSVASEGFGSVILELEASVPDVQRVVNEVRSSIARIPSLPELAEEASVEQITFRTPAIILGVKGPNLPQGAGPEAQLRSRQALRAIAEQIRDDLLEIKQIGEAQIQRAQPFQIDIEVSEQALDRYGLSIDAVAQAVRRENVELPGGQLKSSSGTILLRGADKRSRGQAIAEIPLIKNPDGGVLTVGDVATVRDAFKDDDVISTINGRPGLAIEVLRTESEDLLAMVREVRRYMTEDSARRLPDGYELVSWNDTSVDVRERMELLIDNGTKGLLLVFLVLAIFLEIKLAFWVALGIPISMLGAGGYLLYADQTLNMLSMFAFLMALGIVVDDAIVVGENIYAHQQEGKPLEQAAIDGATEVAPSVTASVTTTVIAFGPLLFVSGVMGKFIGVMPIAVIAMLIISLVESLTILPSHLAHANTLFFGLLRIIFLPLMPIVWLFGFLNRGACWALDQFIDRIYAPVLGRSIGSPVLAVATAASILIFAAGFVGSGRVPFIVFPKLDAKSINASVEFPDGTPMAVTDAAARKIEQAIKQVDREHQAQGGAKLVKLTRRLVGEVRRRGGGGPSGTRAGGHLATVEVELTDTADRDLISTKIVQRWRAAVGELAGAESAKFGARAMGPGGAPIEFKLLAKSEDWEQLQGAVEMAKQELAGYAGVFDIADDSQPGKWEYQLSIKEAARSQGLSLAQISRAIRDGYFGAEVQRLQRGRHEVKLMVRLPESERRSLAAFDDLRLRTPDGSEYPVRELVAIEALRGPSEINRIDQLRSITVSADLDEERANARKIVGELQRGKPDEPPGQTFVDRIREAYPNVSLRWEGQAEQTRESVESLQTGLIIAMLLMYALLTLEFKSYLQPLLILAIVPFGAIGAIGGHWILGLPMTLFSLFGLVALTGVVVNDSIVLVDFINHRLDDGIPLREALIDAGRRRFRPVLLTSVTTVAGLAPILTETSFQAQILIPMATSLLFGLMVATVLILLLVPTFYAIYARLVAFGQTLEASAGLAEPHDEPHPSHESDGEAHAEPRAEAEAADQPEERAD